MKTRYYVIKDPGKPPSLVIDMSTGQVMTRIHSYDPHGARKFKELQKDIQVTGHLQFLDKLEEYYPVFPQFRLATMRLTVFYYQRPTYREIVGMFYPHKDYRVVLPSGMLFSVG